MVLPRTHQLGSIVTWPEHRCHLAIRCARPLASQHREPNSRVYLVDQLEFTHRCHAGWGWRVSSAKSTVIALVMLGEELKNPRLAPAAHMTMGVGAETDTCNNKRGKQAIGWRQNEWRIRTHRS
jgi:hypothetical protein